MQRHVIPAIAIALTSLIGCNAFAQEAPTEPANISTDVHVRVVRPNQVDGEEQVEVEQPSRSVISDYYGSNLAASPDDYDYAKEYGEIPDCTEQLGGRLAFDVEFTLMRYGQENGVADLAGSPGAFDLQLAPRFELAYELADGLGARLRYWFYDAETRSVANNIISVDANYFDIEIFQRLDIGCNTDVEISGGIRYLEFGRDSNDLAIPSATAYDTDAFGGIIGLESRTHLRRGALYARARWGILQGDAMAAQLNPGPVVVASNANDTTIQQLELAFGYETARCTSWGVFTARIGFEWQQWANIAAAGTSLGGIGNNDQMDDASFAGVVFGIGFER